jgi:Flp pilus assembly protein TadG
MRRLADLLRRFRTDESGAFAAIFAVMAIALIAMSGAAVDFTVLQQARTRAQVALDAAALALQPTIYTANTSTIQSQAQALLINRLADAATTWGNCTTNSNKPPCATVATPAVDTTNGQLTLTANLRVPMYFVSLVGVQYIPAQIVSVATRKKLNLEVAMVLDNSGSMDYTMGYNSHKNNTDPTRMDTLKSSATCATNILFYGVTTCSASTSGLTANANVKIGIVPFTEAVNVGTGNATASWLDRTGAAWYTRQNFDSDDYDNGGTTVAQVDTYSGTIDRVALFSKIKDKNGNALSWGGCVEARKYPYDTDDTTPTSSTPDTLFTPYFAPDEPGSAASSGNGSSQGDSFSNSYLDDAGSPSTCKLEPVVIYTQTKTKCSLAASGWNAASNYSSASCNSTTDSYQQTDQNGTVTNPSSLPASIYNNPLPGSYTESYSSSGSSSGNYTNKRIRTYTYIYSNREYQERLCKYDNAKMSYSVSQSSVYGPNGDCPAAAITPLSSTPSTVISAINAMSPSGGTNITEGSAWGFRVLSPTAPFTEGLAYDSATSKVLIIMTDGENTIYPGTNMNSDNYYSAYGFPWNERLVSPPTTSASTLEAQMNSRLSSVCTNAKNAGITVYTIGVDVADTSDPTGNRTLLTNCASTASNAYFPNTAADLQSAFVSIATQLAALRLAQ